MLSHILGSLYVGRMVRIGEDYQAILPHENVIADNVHDDLPARFFVYWIITEANRSYIGATVNLERRIRQHNGMIVGGARRTRNGHWNYHRIIGGFRTWREALQFEWAFKHISRRTRSISKRQSALELLMTRERWTRNSPPASDVALNVYTTLDAALDAALS